MRRQFRHRAALVFGVALWAGIQGAEAAPIAWERQGPFQTCLEGRLQSWVDDKAELVVNDNPAASDLDDFVVALWTAQALESCEAQVGRSDHAAVVRFSTHMAHWRQHIHDVAETIRRRSRPD
jgi:hypothetical protein